MSTSLSLAFAVMLVSLPTLAMAKEPTAPAEPPDPVGRSGFILGVAAGVGGVNDKREDNDGRLFKSLHLHAGVMLGSSVALLGELWHMDAYDSITFATVGLRGFSSGGAWLQVAAGSVEHLGSSGLSLTGGFGYELWQAPSFSVDLRFFAGYAFLDDDVLPAGSLELGVNFY